MDVRNCIEVLNLPLDKDRKMIQQVLNITESLNNEKNNRHIKNIICYKCK